MIVAKWKELDAAYQCSECRMRSSVILDKCPFCDAQMTNWEEMLIKQFQQELGEEECQ